MHSIICTWWTVLYLWLLLFLLIINSLLLQPVISRALSSCLFIFSFYLNSPRRARWSTYKEHEVEHKQHRLAAPHAARPQHQHHRVRLSTEKKTRIVFWMTSRVANGRIFPKAKCSLQIARRLILWKDRERQSVYRYRKPHTLTTHNNRQPNMLWSWSLWKYKKYRTFKNEQSL